MHHFSYDYMSGIFQFGEQVKGFSVRVINDREVRAAAGILFLFAILSLMNILLAGTFIFMQVFIIAFLVDFIIRLFINPKYSPSMTLGRIAVRNQEPEYVSAKQKKFAWYIGLFLVTYMFIVMVILAKVGPINALFCTFCLIFLFFESVFGICLGCKVHYLFYKEDPQLCAGGVCKVKKKAPIQKTSLTQAIVVILFIALITGIFISGILNGRQITAYGVSVEEASMSTFTAAEEVSDSSCIVPQWAIDIGHEELYKEHHGCT